jgi:serine phosphatase RsbU (regulator of sigma subunit)
MKHFSFSYKLIITTLLLVTATQLSVFGQKPMIENGTLDLSKYDFQKNPPISLNGIWEFYPNEFLQPGADSSFSKHQKVLVTVPKLWDKFVFDQTKNPNIGYGTYKLKIILPQNTRELALRMKRVESAYAVFVNGTLIRQIGIPGNSEESATPAQKTCTQFFSVNTNQITLLIHVSNFHHRKGGIDDPIFLGLPAQIVQISDKAKYYEWFMIGVILIMAVFYLGLWLYSYKKYSSLFFGLMLLSEILSIVTNGEVLLTSFFPDLSWALLKKFDYISNFMRITFFAWFFYSLYPKYIYKTSVIILSGVNIILTGIVVFTELRFYSFTLLIFIILSALTIAYVIYAQIKSILARRQGALIPFIGTLILFITAVNDILYVSDMIQTIYLIPFGLFIFIFTQSYLLSFEFSNLYKKEDELNMFITETDLTKNQLLNITGFDSTEILKIINAKTNATRSILFAKDRDYLTAQAVFPNTENEQKITCNRSPVDEAFNTMKPVFINQFNPDDTAQQKIKSLLCCPLMKGEKILGVLYLENSEKKNAFNTQTSEFIENLSDQIIGLHENILIYKTLENINLNLEDIIKKRTKDIRNQQDLLEEQKDEINSINNQLTQNLKDISEKNKIITENINFAKIIQRAGLPTDDYLLELFPEHFILFKPKEVIGGDFYWAKLIQLPEIGDLHFFAVADCTGHGVPGTLMAVIGNFLLNNAISKGIYNPASILDALQKNINLIFAGESRQESVKDGMDIAIFCFNKKAGSLDYAGAKIDMLIFRNGKLDEFKADRITIGAGQKDSMLQKTFINHRIQIQKDDIIYLFSDGFQDQFGGESDTKFMKSNFRALLLETASLQINIQRSRLLKVLNRWQGNTIQNDDILVAGIKF